MYFGYFCRCRSSFLFCSSTIADVMDVSWSWGLTNMVWSIRLFPSLVVNPCLFLYFWWFFSFHCSHKSTGGRSLRIFMICIFFFVWSRVFGVSFLVVSPRCFVVRSDFKMILFQEGISKSEIYISALFVIVVLFCFLFLFESRRWDGCLLELRLDELSVYVCVSSKKHLSSIYV